jgi:hypothetical protein
VNPRRPEEPGEAITLRRDHAQEIAWAVGDLGAWLHQAPPEIRADFTRHAFPDPTIPGAHIDDFLLALGHARQALLAALDERDQPARRRTLTRGPGADASSAMMRRRS